jgi:branched-chain amino acid transport system permease protein
MVLYALIAGVLIGLFYGFAALGLSLAFGVLRVVNIAHGDVIVLGSYLAYELSTQAHINPLFAIPISVPPAVVIGMVFYRFIAPSLGRSKDPEMLSLILFFGVSQVIEALATIGFSVNQDTLLTGPVGNGSVQILGQSFPNYYPVAAAVAVPGALLVMFYLYRSRLGLATRALMSSRADAMLSGIDVGRTSALSFGIALALAASAGALSIYVNGGVSPSQGADLTTTAFAVVVIGGLGNPAGALAGGLVFGLAEQFAQSYEPNWAGMVPYVLLLAVMLVKPEGLLSRRVRYA